jgi:hypothetical protein
MCRRQKSFVDKTKKEYCVPLGTLPNKRDCKAYYEISSQKKDPIFNI